MAKKDSVKKVEEEVVVEAVAKSAKAEAKVEAKAAKNDMFDDVQIEVDGYFKIGKTKLKPGKNIVKRHQLASIAEMVYRKRYSDARISQGKNYLVTKLAGGGLTIKEVDKL